MNTVAELDEFFAHEHLPPHLSAAGKPFRDAAHYVFAAFEQSAERDMCLRGLWEAKNYAVWMAAQKAKKT